MRIKLLWWFSLLFFLATSLVYKTPSRELLVDKILYNATFITLNEGQPNPEAVAIYQGKIVAMGKKDSLWLICGHRAELVDMKGAFVYPGFIDGHAHFYGLGMFAARADLTGCKSYDELIVRLIQFSKTNTEPWLLGRGWDQNLWDIKEFPDKSKLDELFPNKPVLLKRVDGHAALANQKALDLAHITAKSVIEGGKVEVKNGELTGILLDNAVDSLEKAIPDPSETQIRNYLLEAQKQCFENGLTTVVDPGLEKKYIDVIQQMQREGILKIRLNVMVSAYPAELDYYLATGPIKTDLLQVNAFKLYGDGALGSRGACLLAPYSDDPNNYGFLLQSPEKLEAIIKRVAQSKFQLCTHSIGDSAVRFTLDAYGRALGYNKNRRWRIEHAQIVHPADVKKFGQYGILPSMQPTHAMSDMDWADERLGAERVQWAYTLKTLLRQNGLIILGTDFPVEAVSPLATFYTATQRVTVNGHPPGGFQPQNALTPLEALKGMTVWAAYGSFEEKEKGSMEVGKFADFTVLDKDILTEKAPYAAKIVSTWVGGERVH